MWFKAIFQAGVCHRTIHKASCPGMAELFSKLYIFIGNASRSLDDEQLISTQAQEAQQARCQTRWFGQEW